ncbi:phage tail tape measure protein [Muribaculum sp. An289]|uniref:tape measure protein n=1 Tax=Muribaculum sp. An289 TaxID=1965624 RepID=UPI000B396EA8|nr:tape measure protein [Muribaculum sp. An289]OUO38339.1 phage tail tape measure protein [Muribaculum sp. An289]
MENIGGALAFKATLDIDDFKVSSEAMGRYIKNASDNAVLEANRMEQSFLTFAQNGARYIVSYLVGQGMMSLVQSIVQVRGQFQQLELAFNTMLRSTEKSQVLMSQLVDTAAKTPFDLTSIAQGAKQMLAFGSNVGSVVDEIVMLGNVASGVSAPLGDLIYLYGTLRSQGRAYTVDIRQFAGRGIPIYEELGKVLNVDRQELNKLVTEGKVGFPEVEKAFKNMTSEGGIYFNLMQEQSKSLTGMLSNLGDAWDSALNKIGKDNEDLFAGAIQGAIDLVENMDEIIRIVQAVTIAYGSYKAAIMLNTLATKGYTGVALIDNTVKQAKIALLKAEATITGQTAAQIKAMTAVQQAHVAALQKELTAEEQANLVKKLRIATIQQLLTAQQQEYLSNLNLTASSANYEAVATSVLTVEQREALSKTDLSAKSAVYRAALEQEVAAKQRNNAATLEAMRTDVKAAAQKVESAKQTAVSAMQATEMARYELYWARQAGDATRIATAEKKLEAAQDNQSAARKAALAAQTDFYTKRKQLEATATRQATAASVADTAAKTTQGAITTALTSITNKATLAMKSLWLAMKSNPIGWILSLVGMLISALTLFKSSEEEATDAMGEFQDTTKKQIDNLDLLFAILRNTEKGTKTHGDAIRKINAICKEYNKTLLDENATIDQQKLKYAELTAAIQQTTAEKIKAKYVEQELQEYLEKSDENYDNFIKRLGNASYDTGKKRTVTNRSTGGDTYEVPIYEASENIRNMGGAVQEAIRSQIEDNAKLLASMSGDAFTKQYNEVVASILNSTKAATKATDAEIAGFKGIVESYLTSQINKAKEMNEAINQVDNSLSAYFAPKDATPVTDSVDYVSMSFEELDKKIQETQTQIDTLNAKKVKVEADTTELQSLKKLMDELTGARDTKTDNLNTESGINERIKQLKEERSNVVINSAKYKELTKTISGLESRLPKTTTRQADKVDPLKDKQLEADRKLEEARISIMEDGYEKRKAILDLQHKENLDRIDREKRELEEARKAAGMGGLTATEQAGFDERRSIENTSYQRDQNKLFDGEIAYKKQQYELYFRWVRNLGEDVANTQFANLLKGGASFKQYLENQIAEMNQKKEAGTLTEGERNHLISLNMQYDEITGAKSAMDLFKESVTEAISQSSTLAERVQAIADAKERLVSGSTGLVGEDEKAEASLFISEKQAEADKEIQDKILNNYRSYEEQKKAIQDEYAMLRSQAIAQNNEEIMAKLNEGENEALSALNASFLMQSDSWRNLFTDLDALTVEQIDKLVRDIQSKMNTSDMNLNPADMKAVLDRLDEAKQKILDVNPFKSLGNAIKSVFGTAEQKSKHSSGNIKTDWKNLASATEGCFNFVNDAIDSCDVLGDLLGETGKSTIQMIQGVATAGIAMSAAIATAEKGSVILAAISIALQAIQWIAGLFNNDDELEERIQNIQMDVDKLSNAFDRLQHSYDQTFWVYSDEERAAHEQRIQGIKDEIAALEQQAVVARQSWDFIRYAQLTKQIKELKNALEQEQNNGDMFAIYELQKQNLREQQELIKQRIQAEKDKKDTDNNKIAELEEAIKDIDTQIEDLERNMLETLAGTDVQSAIDDFADALVDAYCQGEDAAKALGEVTKETLKNAVVEALKRQFLAKAINDAVLYLGEAMQDNVLSDYEKKRFEEMVKEGADKFNMALEGVGDWIKDQTDEEEESDPLTGAVTSMSEETGGVIAGRLNAFVINQSDQIAIMRQNIIYQIQIAQNTKISADELTEIKETLKRIENKDNSLLSQGIS